MALRQNSSTVLLFDLAQLFDKATDAEYSAIKANQEETLCWINYGNEFIIQYNDIIKNSNGKIGEKKAKGIIYDKILENFIIICKRRSKEMVQAGMTVPKKLPEILIKNESDIDTLILLLQQKFKMLKESMSEANFLEHKQNFEAKMGVPTTPHKKELKNKSLALIEYA
ncbi:6720_t:CDS:2 [Gigaspora margarita]|uniref:6720_t:CDS:1 n=1 Tax=Gigaspora margarita TaxID=4874 RepID=A0ABN7WP38_GIGMA|nr:6720_t:CDS:2 [Gigaspora margarita]